MADWKDNKGSGPWDFIPSPNKWGYLNNPLWSGRQDAIDFSEDRGLPLDLPDEHKPCGHWHKAEVSEEVFPAGKWVAAMQQPGTPYIYVYDILYKSVVRIDTSEIPVFVESVLKLDSAYALDYDMGQGNPGAQRGGYCMNKDGTRIWYLFCDQGAYPVVRNHPDAQLIEVDISKTVMKIVKKTLFPNLLPSEPFPDPNWGRVNDGCSDDIHTYWCTDLIAGRIIKIRNSDHSIVDDHTFNYPIEACGIGAFDEPIATIDVDKNTGKLYWVYCRDHLGCVPAYSACRHFIRSDTDLTQEIDEEICGGGLGTPGWQNMVRIYSNYILNHRAYHPSFGGPLYKRGFDLKLESDPVAGSAFWQWICIKDHHAALSNRPTSGADHTTYWSRYNEQPGGDVWGGGESYHSCGLGQEYLQNIFGVKNGKVFTLMHVNSLEHPARLYCIDFSGMAELSNLDVSYYAGQRYPVGYDWDWTSVSAMNYQTGVIAIFRYHNLEERNYVGCFEAKQGLGFLCDVPLHFIKHTTNREMLNEPQSWPFEGFTPPALPTTDPPIYVIVPPGEDPGPGEEPYVPPPPPPPEAPDNVPQIYSMQFADSWLFLDFMPQEIQFYKFQSFPVIDCYADGWQISNTSQSSGPHTVHILVKRGSKPTMADFEKTSLMTPSHYKCAYGFWHPAKPGAENLYWNYNSGSCAEFVEFNEPMDAFMFYVMFYNKGYRSVRNQRVILSIF